MVHFRTLKDQINPHGFNPLFVQLRVGKIEFDHDFIIRQRQFTHDLFGVRAVAHVQTRKNLERFFNFDNHFHTKKVAAQQTLACGLRHIQNKAQERSIKAEHVHTQPEGGQIGLTVVAQLAQGQFGNLAVVKNSDFITQHRFTVDRAQSFERQRAAPQLRTPGPIRARRFWKGRRSDARKRKPAVRLMGQFIKLLAQYPCLIALGAQH